MLHHLYYWSEMASWYLQGRGVCEGRHGKDRKASSYHMQSTKEWGKPQLAKLILVDTVDRCR